MKSKAKLQLSTDCKVPHRVMVRQYKMYPRQGDRKAN